MAKERKPIPPRLIELYLSSHHYIKQKVNCILKIRRYLPFCELEKLKITESEYNRICDCMGWPFVEKALNGDYDNGKGGFSQNKQRIFKKLRIR